MLRHDGEGSWDAEVDDEGDVPGGPWDGSLPDLSEALDIDIQNSPLTNTMPILRHGFHREGSGDFLMAFITTPTLRVEASPQRLRAPRTTEDGSVVRYISIDGDFTAELELDSDGLLRFYPGLPAGSNRATGRASALKRGLRDASAAAPLPYASSPVALTDEQRAMLQLLLEGGQSYDDIGSLLGIAPDEVRTRARSALARSAALIPTPRSV